MITLEDCRNIGRSYSNSFGDNLVALIRVFCPEIRSIQHGADNRFHIIGAILYDIGLELQRINDDSRGVAAAEDSVRAIFDGLPQKWIPGMSCVYLPGSQCIWDVLA